MIRLENGLKISLQDLLKMSWRRLQNVLKMSWRCFCKASFEDFLKTSWQDVLKTSWSHLENFLKTPWRRMAKTNILVMTKTSWRRLEDVRLRRTHSSWSRRLLKTKTSWKAWKSQQQFFYLLFILFTLSFLKTRKRF